MAAKDPDELARQMELQNRVRKIAGATMKPLEFDPGSRFEDVAKAGAATVEAPKIVQVIRPAEFVTGQTEPIPEPEISSLEWLMEYDRYKRHVKPMDFADLEG